MEPDGYRNPTANRVRANGSAILRLGSELVSGFRCFRDLRCLGVNARAHLLLHWTVEAGLESNVVLPYKRNVHDCGDRHQESR